MKMMCSLQACYLGQRRHWHKWQTQCKCTPEKFIVYQTPQLCHCCQPNVKSPTLRPPHAICLWHENVIAPRLYLANAMTHLFVTLYSCPPCSCIRPPVCPWPNHELSDPRHCRALLARVVFRDPYCQCCKLHKETFIATEDLHTGVFVYAGKKAALAVG